MRIQTSPPDIRDAAAAGSRRLKLGLAAMLGVVAGTMLFATEAQGRAEGRRPSARDRRRPSDTG